MEDFKKLVLGNAGKKRLKNGNWGFTVEIKRTGKKTTARKGAAKKTAPKKPTGWKQKIKNKVLSWDEKLYRKMHGYS